jgi:hypothetical protein
MLVLADTFIGFVKFTGHRQRRHLVVGVLGMPPVAYCRHQMSLRW